MDDVCPSAREPVGEAEGVLQGGLQGRRPWSPLASSSTAACLTRLAVLLLLLLWSLAVQVVKKVLKKYLAKEQIGTKEEMENLTRKMSHKVREGPGDPGETSRTEGHELTRR